MGYADIDGDKYRCTDMTLAPSQEPLFYDHVVGLKDVLPSTGSNTKGANDSRGFSNAQKVLWRPSTISYEGSISFPVMDDASCGGASNVNLEKVFDLAKYGDTFDTILTYNCLTGRKFTNCKINTLGLSVTSGDIVQVTLQIIATGLEEPEGDYNQFQDSQKLVTWDKVNINGSGEGIDFENMQAFSLDINNNINTIYTHESLAPKELRVGMQEVGGTLTLYNENGISFIPKDATSKSMTLTVSDFSTPINCVFKPSAIDGSISSIFSTISFAGIKKPFED